MINFGAVPAGSTLPIFFDSFAGATGASVTLTGLAATDIEVYKGTSMTQRSSDTGYTLLDTDGIDLDGVTGIHGFSIDLSSDADAGFYAVGSFYTVVVSAVTIDSQTVNFVAATFRIVAAEGITGHPKVDVGGWLGTAAATPTVAGVPEVDLTHVAGSTTSVSALATGVATLLADLINGGRLDLLIDAIKAQTDLLPSDPADASVVAGLIATAQADLTTLVARLTALRAAALDEVTSARMGALTDWINGGRLDLLLDAVKAVTDALPNAGALTSLAQDATVAKASALSTAQTSIDDLPTNAELATALGTADDAVLAAIAALNNLSQANIRTALGMASANLDTQLADLPTNAELATALAAADDAVLAAIAALNNLSAAQVNAEVVDVLRTDTGTEVSAVPSATAAIAAQIQFLFQGLRNKVDITATAKKVHTDAGAVVGTKTLSDDLTTYSETKMA